MRNIYYLADNIIQQIPD